MHSYLLGPYQGNRHLSIDNYFNYCHQELPGYLPECRITALRPGSFGSTYFAHANTQRQKAWKEYYVNWPRQLTQLRGDLYHIVDQGLAWYRFFLQKGKTMVTVHDLINLLTMRGRLNLAPIPKSRQVMVQLAVNQIKRADAIVCVSRTTADTVLAELQVSAKRVHVVYNIVPAVFRPVSEQNRLATRKGLFPEAEYIVLHVGKPSAYKNRLGVLQIFERVHQVLPGAQLVLTSQDFTQEERDFLSGRTWTSAITIKHPEEQEDLRALYACADVLIFPSLFEGFGWPPLEAMACGCPVVSSEAGALKEVVGEGGVTIQNALNSRAFADAVIQVLRDKLLSAQLQERGFCRARQFLPEKLSPQLADVYRSLSLK